MKNKALKILRTTLLSITLLSAAHFNNTYADTENCSACEVSSVSGDSHVYYGKTLFHNRETDTALSLMGVADHIHLFGKDCQWYGVLSGAVGYTQTQASCELGQYFSFNAASPATHFGSDTASTFFGGTGDVVSIDPDSNARAADFGLSASFHGDMTFQPQIRTVELDFDLFLGLNCIMDGVWARVTVPVQHVTYDLDPTETDIAQGTTYYPADFVDAGFVNTPYKTIKAAMIALGPFGDVVESECGKIDCRSTTRLRVARIDLDLGYEFLNCERVEVDLGIRFTAGTANSQNAHSLFNPIAGAYNNQLGALVNARFTLWQCYEEQRLNLYFTGLFSHLFDHTDTRMLGLNTGDQTAGNSWMLLKQFDENNAYTGKIYRATSALGRTVKVHNNFLTDFSFMFQWRNCNLDLSLGLNFWYRSSDKYEKCISATTNCDGCAFPLDAGQYGIKGVANVGSANDDATFYSKSDSNIHASGTQVAALATSGVANATAADYVLESDICPDVAMAPSAYANKLFGYIGYSWDGYKCPCTCFSPYVGLGGMYEWGSGNRSVDRWGVYAKGGLAF